MQDLVPAATLQAIPTAWGAGTDPKVLPRLGQYRYTAFLLALEDGKGLIKGLGNKIIKRNSKLGKLKVMAIFFLKRKRSITFRE